MNDFEIDLLAEAFRCGYVMVVPTNPNALLLRAKGYVSFVDAAGKFGYVRASITDKGKTAYEEYRDAQKNS